MPAASSLDDAAAPSAVTPDGNSSLPFASILDEQSSANQDADDVSEADAPLEIFDAAVPAFRPPVDGLAALLTASLPGTRSWLREGNIDQSTTTQGSIDKDKPAVDPTVLLLQAALSSVTQRGMPSAPAAPAPSTSGVKDADDIGETDAPLDVLDATIPPSQPRVDSLAALLAASLPGTRPLLRKDEIDPSTTTQRQLGTSPRTSTSGVKGAND